MPKNIRDFEADNVPDAAAAREPLAGMGPATTRIPAAVDPLAGIAYDGGGSVPLSINQRRALREAIGDAAEDPDAERRLLDHARTQREQGERAVAASAALESMRQIKRELVAATQPIADRLHGIEADEIRPLPEQLMTISARGAEREQLVGQLVEKVSEAMKGFRKRGAEVLASYPKTELPELRDLKITAEQSNTLQAIISIAPYQQPADFLKTCWNAALALDAPTCVALLNLARSFKDDQRYHFERQDQPISGGDPLSVAIEAMELVRITWENHAARIAREIVPRLHAQAEMVAQQITSPPYGWTDLLSARLYRHDGRHSMTPDLAPLDGEPQAIQALVPPLDDPEWYEHKRSPFPVIR